MKRTIPNASMERIMKLSGADRVSEKSKEYLKKHLVELAEKISHEASVFTDHAGRKTIKSSDILLAVKK